MKPHFCVVQLYHDGSNLESTASDIDADALNEAVVYHDYEAAEKASRVATVYATDGRIFVVAVPCVCDEGAQI